MLIGLATATSLPCCTGAAKPTLEPSRGRIELTSDHRALVEGFSWAKKQALEYVFDGGAVGKWLGGTLPEREAFCVRDVSHQATGALALGLSTHLKNMLLKFARAVAESRDWCSFWAIDRHDRPSPLDYRGDDDFRYKLPANFDLLHTCYRVYEWTGDQDYLRDREFDHFYRRSLTDFVAVWDQDGDGLMESPPQNGMRGLATYYEGDGPRAWTGGDLVAAHYAAIRAYARVLMLRGEADEAVSFATEGSHLRRIYNETWWNAELGRFYPSRGEGGKFHTDQASSLQILPLYFGIVDSFHAEELFEQLDIEPLTIEENSYLAEAYYRYGRHEQAFHSLMGQLNPDLPHRDYPENVFTAVGTTVHRLVGVIPRASEGVVETRSRLPKEVSWVRLDNLPLLANEIAVHQSGARETRVENHSGPAFGWRAVFAGEHASLLVDGEPVAARTRTSESGERESFTELEVGPGEAHVVRAP